MDKYLVEINIKYSWNPQLNTLFIILLYPLKPPFYYISGDLKGSLSHGAVSMTATYSVFSYSLLLWLFL